MLQTTKKLSNSSPYLIIINKKFFRPWLGLDPNSSQTEEMIFQLRLRLVRV